MSNKQKRKLKKLEAKFEKALAKLEKHKRKA